MGATPRAQMMKMFGSVDRDKVYASLSENVIHKAPSCRVDGESVNKVANVQNIRSGDDNGGWSMIEIAFVSRCIIGA